VNKIHLHNLPRWCGDVCQHLTTGLRSLRSECFAKPKKIKQYFLSVLLPLPQQASKQFWYREITLFFAANRTWSTSMEFKSFIWNLVFENMQNGWLPRLIAFLHQLYPQCSFHSFILLLKSSGFEWRNEPI
jgi:hypothetical protein